MEGSVIVRGTERSSGILRSSTCLDVYRWQHLTTRDACVTIRDMEQLTTAQTAELLGIAQNSVRMAILRGNLKAVKHGRDWLIYKTDAVAYASRAKSKNKPDPLD